MEEEVTREVCSECDAYGLKKHGLTRCDCTLKTIGYRTGTGNPLSGVTHSVTWCAGNTA